MTQHTVRTETGHNLVIVERDTPTTEAALEIILKPGGIVISAEDAREFAITLKLIAEKILTERVPS